MTVARSLSYRNHDPEAAADEFGLPAIPDQIAGLSLETVLSYPATTAAGAAHYAIWRAADGREVQLTITPAKASDEDLGLVDSAALSLQEGPSHVRIVAPDPVVLRAAVEALRPASLGALGSR